MALEDDIAKFQANAQRASQIVNGDASTVVQTDGGPVKSFANAIKGLNLVGARRYATKADLDLDLAWDAGTLAQVEKDPIRDNNGVFEKIGNAGEGRWVFLNQTAFTELSGQVARTGEDVAALQDVVVPEKDVPEGAVDADGYPLRYIVATKSGRSPMHVNRLGDIRLGNIALKNRVYTADPTTAPAIEVIRTPGPGLVFINRNGRAIARTPSYPDERIPLIGGGAATAKMNRTGLLADRNLLIGYGQSLSNGAISGATPSSGTPVVLSTTQPYLNLKFATGPRFDGTQALTAFAPLTEVVGGTSGETPCSAAANALVARIAKTTGLAASEHGGAVLAAACGQNGSSLAQIAPGTAIFDRIATVIAAAYDLTQAEGSTLAVPAMLMTHGEADQAQQTPRATYTAGLRALKDRFIEVVAEKVPSQRFRPFMLTDQPASHLRYYSRPTPPNGLPTPEIALALRDAAIQDPDIFCITPLYWADHYEGDWVHLTVESYRMLGHYYGRAGHKIMLARALGEPDPVVAVDLISAEWQGRVIDLHLSVPEGRLQFETSWVAAAPNMGLDLFDADGTVIDEIVSVDLRGPDRVRVVCSGTQPAGTTLRYAAGRPSVQTVSGRLAGPRGNLCDTAGLTDRYTDSSGVERLLHNRCLVFETAKP
ncbi:hypothetical protein [Inquilinus limosus]|uniref:hypothetical protein n=1 Tax=Inquilinus limosus TaxID=171674 RepID=UPI00041F2E54|nr:hypothetical protein [Inquilinus limosus]